MRLELAKTVTLVGLLSMAACDKGGGAPGESATPKDPAPSAPSASPAASAPAAASTASAASAPPSASAPAVADAGKSRDAGATAKLEPASKRVTGDNFALDLASPGCKVAAECAMTIKLVASGDYHVNAEYPYKFTATPAPGVELLGKGDAATFTRAAGDFVSHDEKVGTMTVRFKPSAPGPVRIAGTYKFSVCSADQCQIEQEKLELTVPVM
ncbi:MAG: hypothetical protein KF850_12465 [Labilithrix sp.]|nr:hypothetical protein [Labilithrix sp.]